MLWQGLRRAGAGAVVLWAAVTGTFFALVALPGRVEDILAGDQADPALQQAIAEQWGLNDPVGVQYLRFLGRLAGGDLGMSYVLRQPVADVIGDNLWPTVELALAAAAVAVVLAILAAVATSGRRRALRGVVSTVELIFASVPAYWVGILLLMAFSFRLHWFPVAGGEGLNALVLPAITLALAPAAVLSQVLREALEHTLDATFIVTVRARGVTETRVRLRHALKHALVPVMSLAGTWIGSLLGGAVIIEQIFGRPGLGSVALTAVDNKDIPVVLVVVLFVTLVYVLVSTLVDIGYLLVDPRLRSDDGR
ncbi:ABC transporter permease [Acrocarpospora pleiomorpha]|uniref:ABC transporter permease n=1 Tax=Acrocarpospora pleiomorpha TaxID=90975 RepID=A0A5M3XS45_9ACTN|nr:ABC transporter permease [Acrocarpospora pleiomorpha]